MTKRERERIQKAIVAYGTAQFECGEWDRNESDGTYDAAMGRADRAATRLWKAIDAVAA